MAHIRIDPRLPVVWRSTRAIQIGGEHPRVILDPFTEREQRMLAAVRLGVPSEALAAIGRCSESSVRAFLARIRPALETAPRHPPVVRVRVRSAAQEEIVRLARTLGLAGPSNGGAPRLGVLVADHAVPLRAYRDWLRDGLAHFAVVFGTETVAVGPVVVPGTTGCLRCADLRRCERDPAWPAIAAQLVELPAATALNPRLRAEALCAAARLTETIAAAGDAGASVPGLRLPHEEAVDPITIPPHPDCGCGLDLMLPMTA